MNRLLTLSTLLVALFLQMGMPVDLEAQTMPQRYATIELFTNTPCPICVAHNPGFFDLIDDYEGYHLISFYPGRPYGSCPIYQANTSENETRTTHRGVFSTPRVHFNGEFSKSSGSVTTSDMESVLGGESFLAVLVSETGGTNRTVDVQLQTFEASPTNTGRLFVAIVEANVLLTGIPSNWEDMHHNVFRQFITPADGQDVDLTLADQTLTFNYTVDAAWDANEVYVLAWVEDPETDYTFNSGTRFDEGLSSTVEVMNPSELALYPNPTDDVLNIRWAQDVTLRSMAIIDAKGRLIQQLTPANQVAVDHLPNGLFFLRATDNEGTESHVRFIKTAK